MVAANFRNRDHREFRALRWLSLKREFTFVLMSGDSNANDIMVISSIIALLHDPTCDRDFTFPFLRIAARAITFYRGYADSRALP